MLNSRSALLGDEFYTKNEERVDFEYISQAKDFIAIYFGAYSNPGSLKFTDFL